MSAKTVFWAAPCIVGITGLTAFNSFMQAEQKTNNVEPQTPKTLNNAPENAISVPAPPSVPISAEPIETNAIAAEPLPPKPKSSPSPKASAPLKKTTPPKALAQKKTPKPAAIAAKPTAKPTPKAPQETALSIEAFTPTNIPDVPDIPIRVAIQRKVQSLSIAVSEEGIITDHTGKVLRSIPKQQSTYASFDGTLRLGDLNSSQPLWIRTNAENGLIFVEGRWYRGAIQLVPDNGALTAVNHVEMQPYLYSVVGAEMFHHWPIEALKAQAIAARSYALVHIVRPASPWYDLGSTQRWQAYKGLNSEASGPRNAVNATKGIVISHNGGIVESLYASSEELVKDAHKGFGMSQYGARDLAQQQLNYRQILSRFYPGTTLSLLQNQ